ncbi:MAG: hypothetical protein WBQ73_01360 [Candidatus Babeliales bacterium]
MKICRYIFFVWMVFGVQLSVLSVISGTVKAEQMSKVSCQLFFDNYIPEIVYEQYCRVEA